jgi:predicted ATP-dependent endonuclease of OLD family
MNADSYKIAKVEIKGLWGKYDLVWELNPDVNVLSGINGSGKSTVLSSIADLLTQGNLNKEKVTKMITVFLNTTDFVSYHNIDESREKLEKSAANGNKISKSILESWKSVLKDDYVRYKDIKMGYFDSNLDISFENVYSFFNIDIISTFDNIITKIGNRPDEQVKTELDRDIFRLQKAYLDFQLNIGKKVIEAVNQHNGQSFEEVKKIRARQERFLEIVDTLFKDTGKSINRKENEVVFLSGKDEISAYQLSSGEKQILVILLTVLVQDDKPSILFMDEPEISLHFDWQKKLIQHILELNPNTQIILATHSPAVIMEGWLDKVSDVKDLITKDYTK